MRRKGETWEDRLDKKAAAGEGAKVQEARARGKGKVGKGRSWSEAESRRAQASATGLAGGANGKNRKKKDGGKKGARQARVIARRRLTGNPPQVIHSVKHATGCTYTDHQIKSIVPSWSSSQVGPVCVVLGALKVSKSPSARLSSKQTHWHRHRMSRPLLLLGARRALEARTRIHQTLPVACRQEFRPWTANNLHGGHCCYWYTALLSLHVLCRRTFSVLAAIRHLIHRARLVGLQVGRQYMPSPCACKTPGRQNTAICIIYVHGGAGHRNGGNQRQKSEGGFETNA